MTQTTEQQALSLPTDKCGWNFEEETNEASLVSLVWQDRVARVEKRLFKTILDGEAPRERTKPQNLTVNLFRSLSLSPSFNCCLKSFYSNNNNNKQAAVQSRRLQL